MKTITHIRRSPAKAVRATGKLSKSRQPFDFSLDSKKAFRKGLEFARDFGASLVVLHVMNGIYSLGRVESASMRQLKHDGQKRCRRELTAFVKRALGKDVKARIVLRTGVPHTEVAETAERENANLIIIGSRGRRGLKRLFLGSTAERVVRLSRCPVLVVR